MFGVNFRLNILIKYILIEKKKRVYISLIIMSFCFQAVLLALLLAARLSLANATVGQSIYVSLTLNVAAHADQNAALLLATGAVL